MSRIILKELRFSNMFSYGANNVIKLNERGVTQLSAVNGSGKTTIALILQELLFSKNVKGVKKTDILNRYIKEKHWEGELDFSVDVDEFLISVRRQGASTKVKLFKNGEDISEHKVLDTYKKIQEILGLDFTVFPQLTYQSSVDLLDFLKATDTNRKKFLINLFNLEKYLDIGEVAKKEYQLGDKALQYLKAQLNTIESFLTSTTIPEYKSEQDIPIVDSNLAVKISEITKELDSYSSTCKLIDRNNMYISERDAIDLNMSVVETEPFAFEKEYQELKLQLHSTEQRIKETLAKTKNLKLQDVCHSCGQPIDISHQVSIKKECDALVENLRQQQVVDNKQAVEWSNVIKAKAKEEASKIEAAKAVEKFEQLTQLIDNSLSTTYPNIGDLAQKRKELHAEQIAQQKANTEAINYNKQISAHNAKVDALKEQKAEFLVRQKELNTAIMVDVDRLSSLNILKKAFSPSGIVAFKLENLTKELEVTINYYLSSLSDGQFQVEFLLDKEKLNISVIDNGVPAPIETVSGGEFSRIQTAVLLAIRSLLSKLGGSSINLLFLDEITGVLDAEGKEKLIEVLQAETELNVFLISHEFSHPLVEKTIIVKENDISSVAG